MSLITTLVSVLFNLYISIKNNTLIALGKQQQVNQDLQGKLNANEKANEIAQRVNNLSDADVERILHNQFSTE